MMGFNAESPEKLVEALALRSIQLNSRRAVKRVAG